MQSTKSTNTFANFLKQQIMAKRCHRYYCTKNPLLKSSIISHCCEKHEIKLNARFYAIFIPDHDDVIKWKHFPCYWPFVRGIHRSPVNSPHKGQWHGALMFPLICARINGWVNNREAGDLWHNRAHYDVTVMDEVQMARAFPEGHSVGKWNECQKHARVSDR